MGCRSDIVDGVVMAAFGVVMVRGWLRLCGLVVAVGLVGVWVGAVMVPDEGYGRSAGRSSVRVGGSGAVCPGSRSSWIDWVVELGRMVRGKFLERCSG